MRNTKIYNVWRGIKKRILVPTSQAYKNYGGRGLTLTKKWLYFEGFFVDMGNTYKEGLSIDRINNNKGYSKSNCRWNTTKEQTRNQRTNVKYKGEIATDAAKRLGLCPTTIHKRLENGWSKKRAFTSKSLAK